MKKTRQIEKIGFDIETLKRWKNCSTKAKIEWLDSALKFGKAPKIRTR